MNSITKIKPSPTPNQSFCKLLTDISQDFEQRRLQKCHQRGHTKIRRSHSSLFSNLGSDAVRLTELAERAGITQQAMGKLVKEMERLGYVRRHTDETDKRAKIIELTELGQQFFADNTEIISEVIAEYSVVLGDQEFRHLERVLHESATSLGLTTINSQHLEQVHPAQAQ